MFTTLFSLPSAADIISSTLPYSTGFFSEFLGVAWIPVGITVGVLAVLFIIRQVRGGAGRLLGGRRGGRRRGRR